MSMDHTAVFSHFTNRTIFRVDDRRDELPKLLLDPGQDWLVEEGNRIPLLNRQSPSHVFARLWNLRLDQALKEFELPISWLLRLAPDPLDLARSMLTSLRHRQTGGLEAEDLLYNLPLSILQNDQLNNRHYQTELKQLKEKFDTMHLIWISYDKFNITWDILFKERSDFSDFSEFKSVWSIHLLYELEKACTGVGKKREDVTLLQIGGGHALFATSSSEEDVKKIADEVATEIHSHFVKEYNFSYKINYTTSLDGPEYDGDHPIFPGPDTLMPTISPEEVRNKFEEMRDELEKDTKAYRDRWSLCRSIPMKNDAAKHTFYLDGIDISRFWKQDKERVWRENMIRSFQTSKYLTCLMETTIGALVADHVVEIDVMGGDEIMGRLSACTDLRTLERSIVERTNAFIDDFGAIAQDIVVRPMWWLGCSAERLNITVWSEKKKNYKVGFEGYRFRHLSMYPVRRIL